MRHVHMIFAVVLGALTLAACESNPPLGPDDHGHELFVELTMSSDHIHTLNEVELTVAVTNDHGEAVADFEEIVVQRRYAEGGQAHDLAPAQENPWRDIDLELAGDVYRGTYTFATSAEYEFRVMGQRPGEAEMMVLHEMAEPVHVLRAHAEIGGRRVEFETFPGHLHEGDLATVKFWILETERNDDGVRPPFPGLNATIVCNEADGSIEHHAAHEESEGVYVAEHQFVVAGDFVAQIEFPGIDGTPVTAEFTTHVVHAH